MKNLIPWLLYHDVLMLSFFNLYILFVIIVFFLIKVKQKTFFLVNIEIPNLVVHSNKEKNPNKTNITKKS